MASSPFKQLKEHLHDQQKPFVLEVYIAERRTLLNRKPKESLYFWNNKRAFKSRELLKFILYKFRQVSSSCNGHENGSILNSVKSKSRKTRAAKGYVKVCNLVTLLASAKFNNQQDSAVEKTCEAGKHGSLQQKGNADVKRKSQCKEDDEQCSPVSVLDGIGTPLSNQGASASNPYIGKNSGGEYIVSILLWELLTKTLIENHSNEGLGELQEVIGPGFYQNPKRELQQQKQLLLDCVKEAIEVHRRMHKTKEFISLNELTKFIAEQVFSWRKQSAAKHMLFDASWIEEWSYKCRSNREIAIEIGDSIIDQIILEAVELLVQ